MQPETRFKLKVARRLDHLQKHWRVKVQQLSIRGTPDFLICFRGWFVAFELKVPPNKVKSGSLQEFNLASISEVGGLAREVTPENLEECIQELLCLPQLEHGLKGYSVTRSLLKHQQIGSRNRKGSVSL
jgi:hypothetical protein